MSSPGRLTLSEPHRRTRWGAAVLAGVLGFLLMTGCAVGGGAAVGGIPVAKDITTTTTPTSPAAADLSDQRIVFSWNTAYLSPEYAYGWRLTLTGDTGSVTLWRHYSKEATSTASFTVAGSAAARFRAAVAEVVKTLCGPGLDEGETTGGPSGTIEVTSGSARICRAQMVGMSGTNVALSSLQKAALSIIPPSVSATFKP